MIIAHEQHCVAYLNNFKVTAEAVEKEAHSEVVIATDAPASLCAFEVMLQFDLPVTAVESDKEEGSADLSLEESAGPAAATALVETTPAVVGRERELITPVESVPGENASAVAVGVETEATSSVAITLSSSTEPTATEAAPESANADAASTDAEMVLVESVPAATASEASPSPVPTPVLVKKIAPCIVIATAPKPATVPKPVPAPVPSQISETVPAPAQAPKFAPSIAIATTPQPPAVLKPALVPKPAPLPRQVSETAPTQASAPALFPKSAPSIALETAPQIAPEFAPSYAPELAAAPEPVHAPRIDVNCDDEPPNAPFKVCGELALGALGHDDGLAGSTATLSNGPRYGAQMTSFDDFALKPELLRALTDFGFEIPAAVQQEHLSQALLGKDVIMTTNATMDKTTLYVLATLQQLVLIDGEVSTLVLCHSQERANQIKEKYDRFAQYMPGVKTAVSSGETTLLENVACLQENLPHIMIACPGRMKTLLKKGVVELDCMKHFVFDEADKLLCNPGCARYHTTNTVFEAAPPQKQVILFAKTITCDVRAFCKKHFLASVLAPPNLSTLGKMPQKKSSMSSNEQPEAPPPAQAPQTDLCGDEVPPSASIEVCGELALGALGHDDGLAGSTATLSNGPHNSNHVSMSKDVSLKRELTRALSDQSLRKPSGIHQKGLFQALLGKDVIMATTANLSKNLLYVLATLQQLVPVDGKVSVLVLSHSKERASQIKGNYDRMAKYLPGVKTEVSSGEIPVKENIALLKANLPHIMVATPSRLKDLLDRGTVNLDNLKHFVIDEGDMLFKYDNARRDAKSIFRSTPIQKQVMLFAKTISDDVQAFCRGNRLLDGTFFLSVFRCACIFFVFFLFECTGLEKISSCSPTHTFCYSFSR